MPTNRFVESSFWNFDSLFQPQSHPSRDMHDTFFLKGSLPPLLSPRSDLFVRAHKNITHCLLAAPAAALTVPEEYLTRVKEMHEKGGHGSEGYNYDWKREEAFKNILRTHTTAISSRMLYKLANVCTHTHTHTHTRVG
jgi:phenylalanyl-tRNA synthetase alpha chain